MKLFGGIESGGTKFVCSVGRDPDHIISDISFPTTNPTETIQKTIEFFAPYSMRNELTSVGIASFGPVDLNPASQTFGFITTTPKTGWQQVDWNWSGRHHKWISTAWANSCRSRAYGYSSQLGKRPISRGVSISW